MKENKSINKANENILKSQKHYKNENKIKNQNIIINNNNTNYSNDNNINNINNIIHNSNKSNLKEPLNQIKNDININNIKNLEKINDNIQKYSKPNKIKRRVFNSRDKILNENSNFIKGKSKNEFITNNLKRKNNLYFNDNDDSNNNSYENKNIKKIIYKKNNNILKNNLNKKNKRKRNINNEENNFIKIKELNELLSSDPEEINNSHLNKNILENNENNSDVNSKFDEKDIISNTLTVKDELVNFESDGETNIEKNILMDSNNFNNELALVLDKHLTQINFNKNYKDFSLRKISSHSPPPKQINQDKKTKLLSLNLNTINQDKEKLFQNNSNKKGIPLCSSKNKKKEKNLIRNSHHIIKEKKKELILINYLKKNFFSKNEDNKNVKNKNVIHRSKNDINNYQFNEEISINKKAINDNKMKTKKSNGDILNINEDFQVKIDNDEEEKYNKIKVKDYKLKNNSIINEISCFNDPENNLKNLDKINNDKLNNDKLNSYFNYTLNKKNNNSINNNYTNFIKKGDYHGSISFIKNKNEIINKNGKSLENENNFDKKKKCNNLCKNNSQNSDIKKKDSFSSVGSNVDIIKENEKNKNIYQLKVSNINMNKKQSKKEINDKIESIEIANNTKLCKRIPSPQHKNKDKNNFPKKQKESPNSNIISSKISSSNNLINISPNSNITNIPNNSDNISLNNNERTKSNSNNFIECINNKSNKYTFPCQERSVKDFINKEIKNSNKFPSKKNIKFINKNINPQKYKGSYKISQKKSVVNENSNINNNTNNNANNNCNPSTSISNNNNCSGIYLGENLITDSKSPKMNKNNINFNSANKYIILNKNKRNKNLHNNISYNNEDIINNNLSNYINSNSYSTADKNSFINSDASKLKTKVSNSNNQKGANQNYIIHPKKLFPNNINKNNLKRNENNSKENSITKINNSNSNIYYDMNINNNKIVNNKNNIIISEKKLNIYLYKNGNNSNKKLTDNTTINNSPEIIKKSSTTMKSNKNNNNQNNVNFNNRNSINGNKIIFHTNNYTNNIYDLKKNENKKISNKIIRNNNIINNISNGNINNSISNNINNNNIHEDTLIDGQIPTVADENPNVNSLKIMKYNKCAYTNQIISQKFTKIFYIKDIKFLILKFLTGSDLYNLSLVNNFYYENTISNIYEKIIEKVLKNKDNIKENLWHEILNESILNKNINSIEELYSTYLNYSNKYDQEITKDLTRTLPNNILFKKGSNNYKKLFNVLKAYSNFNKKIGYAQGMNFIVAKLIIFYNNEIECFFNLDSLVTKLNFSDVVGISNGLELKMSNIQFLLQKFCPYFITFLEDKKISHEMFTVSWVITLFSKNFENNKLLLIIWNFAIIFGWKFIYLFTVSIINNFHKKFKDLELYEFTQFMKKIFKSKEFEENFNSIIESTFEYMKQWKKINKELEKNMEITMKKTDTESGTEIIIDSFDEDTIIQ